MRLSRINHFKNVLLAYKEGAGIAVLQSPTLETIQNQNTVVIYVGALLLKEEKPKGDLVETKSKPKIFQQPFHLKGPLVHSTQRGA